MLEALVAGQRDPRALAELARGPMRAKRAALAERSTPQFDDCHAELARVLLDQIDAPEHADRAARLSASSSSTWHPPRARHRVDKCRLRL
jgi:hypothetical protein